MKNKEKISFEQSIVQNVDNLDDTLCLICQEEKKDFYSLTCGHRFCLECYRRISQDFAKK